MWGPHYQKLSAVPGRSPHGSLNSHKLTHGGAAGTGATQVSCAGVEAENCTDAHSAAAAAAAAARGCRGSGPEKKAADSQLKPTVLQAHSHAFNELIFLQMVTYF